MYRIDSTVHGSLVEEESYRLPVRILFEFGALGHLQMDGFADTLYRLFPGFVNTICFPGVPGHSLLVGLGTAAGGAGGSMDLKDLRA